MKRYFSPFVFGTLQTPTTLKDENMKILVFGTLWAFSVQLLNEDTCTRNENFFLYFNYQNCFARKSKKSNLLECMAWKVCSNRNINNQTKKQKLHPKQKLENWGYKGLNISEQILLSTFFLSENIRKIILMALS